MNVDLTYIALIVASSSIYIYYTTDWLCKAPPDQAFIISGLKKEGKS